MSTVPAVKPPRLTSLDQFRGYTMQGMLLVNFLGGYSICPRILKHSHDYCSYADTIMPQFLFAAGFALRLSLGRRLEAGGKMPWGRALRRILGLALVAVIWYSFCDLRGMIDKFNTQDLASVLYSQAKRGWFQTLMHIAVTSLWILPVISASVRVRIAYAVASGVLHIVLSWWFNFVWVNSAPNGIDGGPLGFLTWTVPAICGTLACDAARAWGTAAVRSLALCGIGVMALAWGMSCGTVLYNVPLARAQSTVLPEVPSGTIDDSGDRDSIDAFRTTPPIVAPAPGVTKLAPDPVLPSLERLRAWDGGLVEPPFVPPPDAMRRQWNYWMMSQRSGNLSYPTFAAGLSLLLYAGFLGACDGWGWTLGIFRTLGTNSLAAYLLHDIAGWTVAIWFPESSPSVLLTLTGFACFTASVYAVCRFLEWRGWYLRV